MPSRSDNQASLPVTNRQAADEKVVAERQWRSPLKVPAPQQPCDIGIFSDDMLQKELF